MFIAYAHDDLLVPLSLPLTQDASTSAYQIMSYLLLDLDLGKRTNLIYERDSYKKIEDLYASLLDEVRGYFKSGLDPDTYEAVQAKLTRKLFKLIHMPIVYG